MKDINMFLAYIVEIIGLVGLVVEITPIKFSPLSWLGKRINRDIKRELEDIKKELKEVKKEGDMREVGALRSRISSFDLLVRKDSNLDQLERHQYITAFKDIDKWNKYHNVYPELNGELKSAIEHIEDSYKRATFK